MAAEESVAVIAIHGVGEHASGNASTLVAKQLLTVCGDKYSDAGSSTYTLSVKARSLFYPAESTTSPVTVRWRRLVRGMGSGFLHRSPSRDPKTSESRDVDQRFTMALLADGQNYESTYTTVCHSLTRKHENRETAVDIHELYWSDLSHPGTSGGLKVFDQFTQLLLHVASLGRTTLATVVDELTPKSKEHCQWHRLYAVSSFSYWLLAMPILQGNLLFLLLACLLASALGPILWLQIALAAAAGTATAFITGWGYFQLADTRCAPGQCSSIPLHAVPLSAIAGMGIGLLCWPWLSEPSNEAYVRQLAGLVELALLIGLGTLLMQRYDKIRPGALFLWGLVVLALLALGSYVAFSIRHDADCAYALLTWLSYTAEGLFLALVLVWLALFITNAILVFGAIYLGIKHRDNDEHFRALGTSLLAAALPAPVLISVILGLWGVSYTHLSPMLPEWSFTPWLHHTLFPSVTNVKSFLEAMIANSATYLFVPYLALMSCSGILLLWGLLPSIKAEIVRPSFRQENSTAESTIALGRWLDGGFTAMGWGAVLAGIGFFVLLPAGVITQIPAPPHYVGSDDVKWIATIGQWVGGGAASYLTATQLFSWFSKFFARFRVPVDAALDVDNWLRERPRGNTPRLRIFARFNALLQHLEAQGYARIVIVAHSQGTVVAADFFRYFKCRFPERHKRLRSVSLFTLGSPLRQLYAMRFPVLYHWVNRPPLRTGTPGPKPEECGFSRWINGFGSGDYVGRYLWAPDTGANRWMACKPNKNTMDFCLGPHAHTHYFDADNELVGQHVDALVSSGKMPA